MRLIVSTVDIARPPEEVFSYATDPSRFGEWQSSVVSARGVAAAYLMSLARNWGLPIRHHSQCSGIGHPDLPVSPSPAMRAVTMRKGALGRLELITRIPGHDNIVAAARVLYDGRASAMAQMLHGPAAAE